MAIHKQSPYKPCQSLEKRPRCQFGMLVAGTALIIISGGATHTLTIAILTVVLGLGLLLKPPQARLGRAIEACWLILLAWILLALCLPAGMTEWRLGSAFRDINLSPTISPQPLASIESLVPFLTGSAILLLAVAYRPTGFQRRRQIHLLAALLCTIGILSIIAGKMGLRLPWADQVQVFSWFPNRNQTALVFASGSVLFFGMAFAPFRTLHSNVAKSNPHNQSSSLKAFIRSFLAVFGASLLLYAIFKCLSRGALLGWFCGIMTLIALQAHRAERTVPLLLRLVPSLALLIFAFFIFMGGASRDRFIDFISLPFSSGEGHLILDSELRWQIYADTRSMISEQPWTGVGIGNYQYVFPFYRSIPSDPVAFRHPESDWLWWLSELGIVGLTIIVAGLFSLLIHLRAKKRGPTVAVALHDKSEARLNQLYRHTALAALVPFFVHSFVDVGAHRLGTASLAILLYALALPESKENSSPPKFIPRLWRFSGGVLLCSGLVMLSLHAFKSPYLASHATKADEPLRTRPLQWQPYFRFATRTYSRNPEAALESFYKARSLMPYNSEIPLREGFYLLNQEDPTSAFAAFSSAINTSTDPGETFRRILQKTASKLPYHRYLRSLAHSDEALILEYWRTVPRRLFRKNEDLLTHLGNDWDIVSTRSRHVLMKTLNRNEFYSKSLELYENSDPATRIQLWSTAVPALVAAGREKEALVLFDRYSLPIPLPKLDTQDKAIQELRTKTLLQPDDPIITTRLLMAYLSRGMWDDARRTAEKSLNLSGTPHDNYYWLGLALSNIGQEKEAARAYAQWLTIAETSH